jgi:hypothetical protein
LECESRLKESLPESEWKWFVQGSLWNVVLPGRQRSPYKIVQQLACVSDTKTNPGFYDISYAFFLQKAE